MPVRACAVLTLAAFLAACAAAQAGDWPRFRGPNGDGASDDKDIPVKWSKDNVLWKTPIPGAGHSSPIVWGDRIFLQTSSRDGKERQLVCLDAKEGKILWSKSAPGDRFKTLHKRNSLASGTPATDGERVYAAFFDGANLGLYAWDFKGELVWSKDLGPYNSQHGAGHSPIVWRDRVILADDQDGSAVLYAFEAKTGKEAWKAERKAFRACYSTPLIREKAGGPELLVASTAGVTSYDPATGKENWAFSWKFSGMALRTVSSPVVSGDLILATSGDGSGARHAVAVKLDGKGDVSGTNLVWENRKTLPYVPSPLALGEHIYTVNDLGVAACHVAKTGEEVWSKPLNSPMTASPVLIDGKVYAIGEDGEVYVYEAGPAYKPLARNSLGEDVSASPAVANGRLFIRGKQHLYCIGKPPAK